MKIAIPLFDRMTALDAIGPYDVLSRLDGAAVTFVGHEPGVVRTDTGMLGLSVDRRFEDLPQPDVVVFPGGNGTRALLKDERVLGWLCHAHEHTRYTTSVCTGALVLGAAGLLDGLEATTHWCSMDVLEGLGAKATGRRVVEQGKIITAAGVSSGIDMALFLAGKIAGDTIAQAIQLGIEYDPQPPYDSGAPDKAPEDVVALVRRLEASQAEPAAA
jgi:putative intracellular protease/amidase